MTEKITLGVIGTGWITHDYVSHSLSTGKFSLGAVYSRKHDTAAAFASKYPDQTPTLYTTLDDLAADANITTVYIASPNILHYEQAQAMLHAGKHVILEKPLATSEAQLDALFALAATKQRVLVEAFRHVHEANFKILKQSLPKVGALLGANLSFCQYSSRYEKVLLGAETPAVFDLKMAGGALVDLGIYVVAAAVELFGPPESSVYHPMVIPSGCDGGGTLVLKYAKDVQVSLQVSKMYASRAPSEVYGTQGTLSVPTITDIERVTFWDVKNKGPVGLELGTQREALNLKEEAVEHARIILEADWESVKRWEAHSRAVVRVMEGVRRANGLLFPGEE
ncbi:NAD(P)-binding protein [Pleomassaria siparia CBS 279.74]|uniref:NAD(P)-binding protein n=1 Tax=Pleomassaria siparia CBS 279.74 TaxID=1314801 RepID=A0A6G1KAT1_9PLEO|nr:NAD(P)-binding protein [Pleomassaria siparia CBS 279.74]